MEMYKKISLIASPEDKSDITDEFLDRFGDIPRSVERLLSVALLKALCEKVGFSRVEARDGYITIHVGRPELSVWSEVFGKFPGMRFAGSGDRVSLRIGNEDGADIGSKILEEYYSVYIENTKSGENNE